VAFLATRRIWKCRNTHPRQQFSVKVGTIFEDSAVGLEKWLAAIWIAAKGPSGISSYQVARELRITQKTAWRMMDRIRRAMRSGGLEGILANHPVAIKTPEDDAEGAAVRSTRNGAPADSLERFEYLARALFGVRKDDFEERCPQQPGRNRGRSRKTGFTPTVRRFAMHQAQKKTLCCSFCGKSEDDVKYLLAAGNGNVYICGGCVDICVDIINKTKSKDSAAGHP